MLNHPPIFPIPQRCLGPVNFLGGPVGEFSVGRTLRFVVVDLLVGMFTSIDFANVLVAHVAHARPLCEPDVPEAPLNLIGGEDDSVPGDDDESEPECLSPCTPVHQPPYRALEVVSLRQHWLGDAVL